MKKVFKFLGNVYSAVARFVYTVCSAVFYFFRNCYVAAYKWYTVRLLAYTAKRVHTLMLLLDKNPDSLAPVFQPTMQDAFNEPRARFFRLPTEGVGYVNRNKDRHPILQYRALEKLKKEYEPDTVVNLFNDVKADPDTHGEVPPADLETFKELIVDAKRDPDFKVIVNDTSNVEEVEKAS